ncbi:MAG: ribosome maturation factor RimP [Synergistaceae bacterium]|jgi:ribosome maturation factor RimP|nr:ribosome maturation factor RimP [Synergistaceae bacterium]
MVGVQRALLKKNIMNLVDVLGYECVGVEITGPASAGILRIYIDSPGGILHADCEKASSAVSEYLERCEEEGTRWFPGKYSIEVSSPGLERPLFTPEQYARFIGSDVMLKTNDKKKISGRIMSCEGEVLTLRASDGEIVSLHVGHIKKGNLVYVEQKGAKKK